MFGELRVFVANPYTWLAVSVAAFLGVWWYRMNATYANLTLVIAVGAGTTSVVLHPWVASFPFPIRGLMGTSTASLLSLLAYFTLWIPAVSLGFGAMTSSAEQPAGAVVGSIAWKPAYREVHVRITNGSDLNVDDLDLVIRPDQPITAVGQTTSIAGVSIEPHDQPSVDPQWLYEGGRRIAIPVAPLATSKGYRIRCGVFPRRSTLTIVMAAATFNEGGNGPEIDKLFRINFTSGQSVWFAHQGHSDAVFGPKPIVTRVTITGQYTAAERPYEVSRTLNVTDPAAAVKWP